MRRLAQSVILWDEKAQAPIVLEAGTVPDEWAADQITNPKAWAPEEEPTPDGGGEDPDANDDDANDDDANDDDANDDDANDDDANDDDANDDDANDDDATRPEAPRKNASREDWAEYAKALGFDVSDDATRGEIIAAIDADRENTDA